MRLQIKRGSDLLPQLETEANRGLRAKVRTSGGEIPLRDPQNGLQLPG